MTLMQVEISINLIVSLIAIALSAYSITVAKKRNDNADLKEMATTLTTYKIKLETIENAVLGKPTLSEQVVIHDQKLKEHDRRIDVLEKSSDKCEV